MTDILLDAFLDTLKTLPFLFGAYFLIEYLEHRGGGRLASALAKLGPWGPLGGAALGCVPQCGFSVAAANLYAGGLISPGTLVAVFLSTSDEALPILLSHPSAGKNILSLLGVKLAAGAVFGLLTDFVCRRFSDKGLPAAAHEAHKDHCCEHAGEPGGVLRAALVHTGQVALFLLIINLALDAAFHFVGEETISRLLLSGSVFQPLLAALVGFIPNCAASVLLTELYLSGSLSFGAAVAGLCTGAGLGMAVLFRANRPQRENLLFAAALYVFAVATGLLCGLAL